MVFSPIPQNRIWRNGAQWVATYCRRRYSKDVPKSLNHVYEKLLPQDWDIFLIYFPVFYIYSLFILFYPIYKFAALWSPRDHDECTTSVHKGNPAKMAGRMLNKCIMYKNSSLGGVFQKWTFINVLFLKTRSRFKKNDENITQSIML